MKTLSLTPTGTDFSKEFTAQERVQMNCDAYNESLGNLNQADGYTCELCKNKGFISYCVEEIATDGTKDYREVLKQCKCNAIRKSIRRLKRSGLENIIRECTFEKFIPQEPWQKAMLDLAKRFCKDEQHTCFFVGGGNGTGKTHICTAICGFYLKYKKAEVRYMLWQDETVPIKAVVNDETKYQDAIKPLKEVEVLYIDDFFKIVRGSDGRPLPPTPADIKIAYEVLNYRYNNPHLTTIISSERYIGEILDIDEATGSRLLEKLDDYVLNIGRDRSKNQRLKKSKLFDTL